MKEEIKIKNTVGSNPKLVSVSFSEEDFNKSKSARKMKHKPTALSFSESEESTLPKKKVVMKETNNENARPNTSAKICLAEEATKEL